MDPEIGKAAILVTEKMAEKLGSNLLNRWFSANPSKSKSEDSTQPGAAGKSAVDSAPRTIKSRGSWDRRNNDKDRRVSPVSQRLRKGFWLEFHRKTELGKFDPLSRSSKTRDDLFDALIKEAMRYSFSERNNGAPVEPAHVVDVALDITWAAWSNVWTSDENKAVIFIEAVAQVAISKFNVSKVSRRTTQRRET